MPHAERILFALIEHKYVCGCGCSGRHTINAIFDVMAWDFANLFNGKSASKRHDNNEWLLSDKKMNRHVPTAYGFYARLCQVRADWSALKMLLGFKGWAANYTCWKCSAQKDESSDCPFQDFTREAAWSKKRIGTLQFIKILKECKRQLTSLFSVPGFLLDYVTIDHLHTVDLGVAQIALGNLMWEALRTSYFNGRTLNDRLKLLWDDIKIFYKESIAPSQINTITHEMIRRTSKSPQFRGKASETRYLVPHGLKLAQHIADRMQTSHWNLVHNAFKALVGYYLTLGQVPFNKRSAEEFGKKLLMLYSALNKEASDKGMHWSWIVKPKFHLFSELIAFQLDSAGDPSLFWTYQDEDFMGWLASMAHSRGSKRSMTTTPLNVLKKYAALSFSGN